MTHAITTVQHASHLPLLLSLLFPLRGLGHLIEPQIRHCINSGWVAHDTDPFSFSSFFPGKLNFIKSSSLPSSPAPHPFQTHTNLTNPARSVCVCVYERDSASPSFICLCLIRSGPPWSRPQYQLDDILYCVMMGQVFQSEPNDKIFGTTSQS